MVYRPKGLTLVLSISTLSGCVALPDVPDDHTFPLEEILRYTACELKIAYKELSSDSSLRGFKASEYAITVQLQPKTDTEFTAKAGLTGKNTQVAKTFNSWAFGAATGGGAPGAGYDSTGHQDGATFYIVKSADLIKDNPKKILDCGHFSSDRHVLEENLGVRDWLIRSAKPINGSIGAFSVDKNSFLAEITIQWDAGGTYTYSFTRGTDFASASYRNKLDEILSITVTHEEPKKILTGVITLPIGSVFGTHITMSESGTATITPETAQRQDLLQLQQSIQNLNFNPRNN